MSEAHHLPSYAYDVAQAASLDLRTETFATAKGERPPMVTEFKPGDGTKGITPVTKLDKHIERFIGARYEGTEEEPTDVRMMGEEGTSDWPEGQLATLDLHVDPIDGTGNFLTFLEELTFWLSLPENKRGPMPISGAAISIGATAPAYQTDSPAGTPQWGVINMPFLSPAGATSWLTDRRGVVRIDPNGSEYVIPPAKDRDTSSNRIVVSARTSKLYGPALRKRGLEPLVYDAGVASALSVLDPILLERLRPNLPKSSRILEGGQAVASLLANGENWDAAAVDAMARKLGAYVTGLNGRPRTYEPGKRGLIVALNDSIGNAALSAFASVQRPN